MKKQVLLTGFLLLLSIGSATAAPLPIPTLLRLPQAAIPNDTATAPLADSLPALSEQYLLDSLIGYAKHHLGVPYRMGGRSDKGFDCSGFTSYIFSRFGFNLPRTSYAQAGAGKKVATNAIRKGDLVFFKGRNTRNRSIGHVGIVISDEGQPVRFIHASVNRGISIEAISSSYYWPRFVKSMRLVDTLLPVPDLCQAENGGSGKP